MSATTHEQRPSGIPSAGDVPWGTHFGVFHASDQELLDVMVPFVRAGLEGNELCSWEVRDERAADEARRALASSVTDLAKHEAIGQLEIVSPGSPAPGCGEPLERRLDRAILAGFGGLRLVRHASTVGALGPFVHSLNVVAALPYPRAGLDAIGLMNVVQEHRFALICNSGRWEVLQGSEARAARAALELSEKKLKSLFENMSEGFAHHRIVLDGEGRPCDYVFLEVNAAFERHTGLVGREIVGKRVTQVLPGIEKDPTGWIEKYGRVALTGEPVQFENHAATLDRWYAVSAFSTHRGYFAVTFSDITGRKEAEAQLLAAEKQLAVTLHSIGDAVIATDTSGRVAMLNRACESLTGWAQAEAFGRPLAEVFRIVNERTGAPSENPVQKVLEAGKVVGLANHTVLVARDGSRRPIADSAAPIRGRDGEVLGVVLVFRDVTEERVAQQLLRESEERLRRSQELAHLGGWELDIPGKRLTWSDEVYRIFGLEPQEFGATYEAFLAAVHPEDRAAVDAAYSRSIEQGSDTYEIEHRIVKRSSGEIRYVHEKCEHVRDSSGRVVRSIGMVHDITERKRAEEALREADRRKNEFLAVLSHELRNPLAPIRNSLFILERASPGSDQARRAQAVIDRQTGQLARLVDDLLDVTRITSNKIQLQRERIDLNEVVRRALEDQRSLLEANGVLLDLDAIPGRVLVNADRNRLAQVVDNLLQNAGKFTARGGTVRASVSVERVARRAVIRVADTGAGMASETLARLFQPFMQADATLDRSKGGLGLGLALVKGLVELHGGTVSAHSDGLGKGAEFVVRLPLETLAHENARRVATNGETKRRRVLIIEDNVDAADSLREVLSFDDHEVEVAYNGPDGLARAREFDPEVVLCDIGLPGMDGFEVARAFRSDEALRDAFLVALSGYALPEDLLRAREAGFDRHLAKPPSLEKLEELLAEVPARGRSLGPGGDSGR